MQTRETAKLCVTCDYFPKHDGEKGICKKTGEVVRCCDSCQSHKKS